MCTRARRRTRQPVAAVAPYRLRRCHKRGEWGKPRLHAGWIYSSYGYGRLSSESNMFPDSNALITACIYDFIACTYTDETYISQWAVYGWQII